MDTLERLLIEIEKREPSLRKQVEELQLRGQVDEARLAQSPIRDVIDQHQKAADAMRRVKELELEIDKAISRAKELRTIERGSEELEDRIASSTSELELLRSQYSDEALNELSRRLGSLGVRVHESSVELRRYELRDGRNHWDTMRATDELDELRRVKEHVKERLAEIEARGPEASTQLAIGLEEASETDDDSISGHIRAAYRGAEGLAWLSERLSNQLKAVSDASAGESLLVRPNHGVLGGGVTINGVFVTHFAWYLPWLIALLFIIRGMMAPRVESAGVSVASTLRAEDDNTEHVNGS